MPSHASIVDPVRMIFVPRLIYRIIRCINYSFLLMNDISLTSNACRARI